MTYLTTQQLKDFPNYKPVDFEKYFNILEIPLFNFKDILEKNKFTFIYIDIFKGDSTYYLDNILMKLPNNIISPENTLIKDIDIGFYCIKTDKALRYKGGYRRDVSPFSHLTEKDFSLIFSLELERFERTSSLGVLDEPLILLFKEGKLIHNTFPISKHKWNVLRNTKDDPVLKELKKVIIDNNTD